MNILSSNSDFATSSFSDKDVLSAFKQEPEKPMTIQKGMSPNEISDVVSEKVIALVRKQFQLTKEQFQSKEIKQ